MRTLHHSTFSHFGRIADPTPSPSSAVSVDSYTPEDWRKLQAAVDALKSPVLDDTVELEPSPIGQLQKPYPHSRSTPNIRRLNPTELSATATPSGTHRGIPGSVTVGSFPRHTATRGSPPYRSSTPLHAPAERRERSHTTPSSLTFMGDASLLRESQEVEGGREIEVEGEGQEREEEGEREGGVLALAHNLSEGNILFENGKFTAKKQRY